MSSKCLNSSTRLQSHFPRKRSRVTTERQIYFQISTYYFNEDSFCIRSYRISCRTLYNDIHFFVLWLLLLSFSATTIPDPEFVDEIGNITVPAGRNVKLACSVKDLGSFKVRTYFLINCYSYIKKAYSNLILTREQKNWLAYWIKYLKQLIISI